MTSLRELRITKGWSQAELARRAGIHPSTVSMIERGLLAAYPAQVEKLAKALGISKKRCAEVVTSSGVQKKGVV
jgi:transcriptional regulator with XRE-family HTH domain